MRRKARQPNRARLTTRSIREKMMKRKRRRMNQPLYRLIKTYLLAKMPQLMRK